MTRLSDKDKLAFKSGIYELFDTIGVEVVYRPLLPDAQENIYGEVESSYIYGEPLTLVATVKHTMVDRINQDNQKDDFYELIEVEIPTLALDNMQLNPHDMDLGIFIIESDTYTVQNVKPKGGFLQMYTSYVFTCRGETLR